MLNKIDEVKFREGIVKSGKYKDFSISIMVIPNEEYFTMNLCDGQNLITKQFATIEQMENYLESGVDWIEPNSAREVENQIINWWETNLPECKNNIEHTIENYDEDEKIGIYIIISHGVLSQYYDKAIEENNKESLKEFLILYNQFYEQFYSKYQKGKVNDLEDMTCIEMFEWLIDTPQKDFVEKCLPSGKLKELFVSYFNNLKN